jgi:putative CocE/NonD family hydrolase
MRHITELPVALREIENIWIPLSDGIRLAARLWLPETVESHPVPAVLEYIPYRKRDMTAVRDSATHRFLAGHGYACIRLGVRGVGDSEGVYEDQFGHQYLEDVLDAIAWIAKQSWCSGEVAMFGLSWGAAIALQAASLRPAALKTIVCAAGIDDRYALRYPGGCLSTATVTSITAQMSYATRPPDPALAGDGWRDMWLARLRSASPMSQAWLGHPRRDASWLSQSIAPDYSRIGCPVLLAAGWSDHAFADGMLRTHARLEVPRLGIFGPWGHRYPHLGVPEPAVGFLQLALRWLDHWLKGREPELPSKPVLLSWMPRGFTIAATPVSRPGRWVGERVWPSPVMAEESWWLDTGRLAKQMPPAGTASVPSSLLVGSGAGEFMPLFATGANPELPGDQREDDAQSCLFDSDPLDNPIEILGTPVLRLGLDAGALKGQVVVRLCEVAPDGSSRRVSWGARNLALADDFLGDQPRARTGVVSVTVPLYATADGFAAGNRIRLAISMSYWPILWPSASTDPLALHLDGSQLALPVRHPRQGDTIALPSPESGPPLRWSMLRAGGYQRKESVDAVTGEHVIEITDDTGEFRIDDIALSLHEVTNRVFRIHPDDPASASIETRISCGFRRDRWCAETIALGRVFRRSEAISAHHAIKALEGETVIFERDWDERILSSPR